MAVAAGSGAEFRIFQDRDVLQIIDSVLKDAIAGMFGGSASPGLYYSLRIQSSLQIPPSRVLRSVRTRRISISYLA